MSYDLVIEEVPPFTKRLGDQVTQGSNNTIIILGTDRAKKGPAKIEDGLGHIKGADKGKGTGTIHIIAGRAGEDPDFTADKAFLYVTAKTKADENLDLASVESATNDKSAVIGKAECIRLVAKENVKVSMDGGKQYIFLDKKKIVVKIGENKIEMDDKKAVVTVSSTILTLDGKEIKLDSPKVHLTGGCEGPWDDLFKAMIDMMEKHNHMSAVGPTTPAMGGPSTPPVDGPLQAKKAAWDGKVKS